MKFLWTDSYLSINLLTFGRDLEMYSFATEQIFIFPIKNLSKSGETYHYKKNTCRPIKLNENI